MGNTHLSLDMSKWGLPPLSALPQIFSLPSCLTGKSRGCFSFPPFPSSLHVLHHQVLPTIPLKCVPSWLSASPFVAFWLVQKMCFLEVSAPLPCIPLALAHSSPLSPPRSSVCRGPSHLVVATRLLPPAWKAFCPPFATCFLPAFGCLLGEVSPVRPPSGAALAPVLLPLMVPSWDFLKLASHSFCFCLFGFFFPCLLKGKDSIQFLHPSLQRLAQCLTHTPFQ